MSSRQSWPHHRIQRILAGLADNSRASTKYSPVLRLNLVERARSKAASLQSYQDGFRRGIYSIKIMILVANKWNIKLGRNENTTNSCPRVTLKNQPTLMGQLRQVYILPQTGCENKRYWTSTKSPIEKNVIFSFHELYYAIHCRKMVQT